MRLCLKVQMRLGGALAIMLIVALAFCAGPAMGASEGAHSDAAQQSESHGNQAGHAAETASGDAHGEAEGHEIHWTPTDWYRLMNFSVLAIGLFLLLRKPVAQALNGRITGIREQLSELEAKKQEAEQKLAQYNQKLALLDKEAGSIVDEYIRQGQEAKARILEEAQAAAVRLEEQAKRNIEHEFQQAKLKLQADIMDKALVEAEKLIRTNIEGADQDRLVDEYLDKVVA